MSEIEKDCVATARITAIKKQKVVKEAKAALEKAVIACDKAENVLKEAAIVEKLAFDAYMEALKERKGERK